MPNVDLQPYLQVLYQDPGSVLSTDITSFVEGASLHFGYDQRISEAEIDFYAPPSVTLQQWGTISVLAGYVGSSNIFTPRFSGYVYDYAGESWNWKPHVSCRGPLILAEKAQAVDDVWAFRWMNGIDYAAAPNGLYQGQDLANVKAFQTGLRDDYGLTDQEMIMFLLTNQLFIGGTWVQNTASYPGIAIGTWVTNPTQIGGINRRLGLVAWYQFVWQRGQPAMAFIDALDEFCLGMRTYEQLGGQIVRTQIITGFVPPLPADFPDLVEGVDFFEGARWVRDTKAIVNRVVAEGYDPGGGAYAYVATGGATNMPPGLQFVSDHKQSSMVEAVLQKDTAVGPVTGIANVGISCEEVAKWWLTENQNPMYELTIPTYRDDLFAPGKSVYVRGQDGRTQPASFWFPGGLVEAAGTGQATHLNNILQNFLIKKVDVDIVAGQSPSFGQTLTLRTADFYASAPPALGVIGLGGLAL